MKMFISKKVKWGTLEETLEIRSEINISSRLQNSLKPVSNENRAEISIEIGWAEEIRFDSEVVRWYPMINGRIGYGMTRVYVEIAEAMFEISIKDDIIRIKALKNHKTSGLPEVVFETALMLLLRKRGWHPLHASGGKLAVNMLFPGRTMSGKSTLALRLHESGGKILSDDRVFLSDENGKITATGFNHQILLRESEKVDAEIKNIYDPEQNEEDSSIKSMIPEALLFPAFKALKEPELTEISPGESSIRLMSLSLPPINKGHMEIFFKLSRQCRSFELALPKIKERPEKVVKLLKEIS